MSMDGMVKRAPISMRLLVNQVSSSSPGSQSYGRKNSFRGE